MANRRQSTGTARPNWRFRKTFTVRTTYKLTAREDRRQAKEIEQDAKKMNRLRKGDLFVVTKRATRRSGAFTFVDIEFQRIANEND